MATTVTPPVSAAVHGPYEDLAIEALRVLEKIIDSQPADVKAALWKGFLEDMQAWRDFWKAFRSGLGDAFKESAK